MNKPVSILLAAACVASLLTSCASLTGSNQKQVTLIHMGDIHGHLVPRPHLRSDGDGAMQGGVARMYTRIEEIRRSQPNHLLINTGDTIQGSAEAMYTRGQALVDVLDRFRIDAFAPGNWEFVTARSASSNCSPGRTPRRRGTRLRPTCITTANPMRRRKASAFCRRI